MSAKHPNPQSSPQSPNPTHIANMSSPSSTSSYIPTLLLTLVILLTTLAVIAASIYYSGQADDLGRYFLKKYYKAEAEAEKAALMAAGQTKAEGFLKERLKKNPMVGNDELNDVSSGLGDDAKEQFGEGGLAKGIGKAFD